MQALSVTTTENWSACLGHYRRRGDAPYKKRYAYVPNNSQTALLASYQNGSDTAIDTGIKASRRLWKARKSGLSKSLAKLLKAQRKAARKRFSKMLATELATELGGSLMLSLPEFGYNKIINYYVDQFK